MPLLFQALRRKKITISERPKFLKKKKSNLRAHSSIQPIEESLSKDSLDSKNLYLQLKESLPIVDSIEIVENIKMISEENTNIIFNNEPQENKSNKILLDDVDKKDEIQYINEDNNFSKLELKDNSMKVNFLPEISRIESSKNLTLEDRVKQLEEQIRVLTMANQELSSHVSFLLSKNTNQQEPVIDMNKVTEIIETHYEVNRRIRTVAIVNTTSGGGKQYGEMLIKRFSSIIGLENVFNIENGPKDILVELMKERKSELRLIVAGGDGSVNWVLNSLDNLRKESESSGILISERDFPKIAVFPLGCGNDLSRVLKWGGSYSPITDSITLYLKRVGEAHIQKLDRWKVTFRTKDQTFYHLMSNYFSIGVDAQVALNFHSLRQENPQLCLNRTTNKLWYLTYGIGEMLKSSSSLRNYVEVSVDGRIISKERIKVQSLIWVNIPSYSGGTNLWHPTNSQNDQFMKTQEFDDGLLELVGVNSIHHMAQIKAGLSNANCVSQGKRWSIIFKPSEKKSSIAAQVDGEPFILNEETEITIEEYTQIDVLIGENPSLFQIISHVPRG